MITSFFRAETPVHSEPVVWHPSPPAACVRRSSQQAVSGCASKLLRLQRAGSHGACPGRAPSLPQLAPSQRTASGHSWRTALGLHNLLQFTSRPSCLCAWPRPALCQRKGVCHVAGCESGSCSSLQGKISSICFSWELVRCLTCFCYSPAHRLHRGCWHIKYSHLRRSKLSMLSQ